MRKYFQDNSTNIRFPDEINVHEHKAPTDESIRLLNEMEEKARRNIVAKIIVEDNTLNGVVLAYSDGQFTSGTYDVRIWLKFTVNGVLYEFEETVHRNLLHDMRQLHTTMLNRLQAEIVHAIFNHLKVKIIDAITNTQTGHEKNLGHKI